jgi:hypothetical protein
MRSDDEQDGDRGEPRTVDVEITRRRRGTTHPIVDDPLTSEDRIEGQLVEEDGKLVLFYGPI